MATTNKGRYFPKKKMLSVAVAMLFSVAVHAQERAFDIPAGDLKAALDAYVTQTGQQLVYRSEDLKGLRSKGVQGAATQEQALERLIEGTSLKVRRDASGALVLFSDEATDGDASAASSQAADTEMPAVIVTATALSHLAESNRTGTRTEIDPMALPQSVSTVSNELLQQQQVRSLSDAVANVAGASGSLQDDGPITMRGFLAGTMRNGNIVTSGFPANAPLITISKIEIVKGPEAIIAGVTSSYGGVVNIITKAPDAEPTRDVEASFGSHGYYEVGADFGGAFNDDKTVLGRLVVSKSGEGRNEAGYDGSDREYIAPSLTWQNRDSGTFLTLTYEHQRGHNDPALLQYFRPGQEFDSNPDPVFVPPRNTGVDEKQQVASLAVTQRIANGWELGLKLAQDTRETNGLDAISRPFSAFGVVYPEFLSIVSRTDSKDTTKTAKLELKGSFDTGPVQHTLLLAYDDLRTTSVFGSQTLSVLITNIETGVTTDATDDLGPIFGAPDVRFESKLRPKETGALILDHMVWGDWVALLGWRKIHYEQGDPLSPNQEAFDEGLPSLGVVYRWTPTFSLYGSASKGFQPNIGLIDLNRRPVEPENSKQWEFGFKSLLADSQLALTGAVYEIKQRNVAVPDFDNSPPGELFWRTVPGVTSRGGELELSGNLTPHLSVRANYAYLDKQASTLDTIGIAYARNQASIWGTYRFGDVSTANGWWVGAGVQGRSSAQLSTQNGSPGEYRIDVNGGYQAERWSIVAGVKNLTDQPLYTLTSRTGRLATLLQPREFYTTLRYRF